MHAFIADPNTPGYPNLARACTQPLTTGPMLAGRSTLIGWTRKIIVTLAVDKTRMLSNPESYWRARITVWLLNGSTKHLPDPPAA